MIEVFKTNVDDKAKAAVILEVIHKNHTDYQANFDLEDCDKILRIRSRSGIVRAEPILEILNQLGYSVSVLD